MEERSLIELINVLLNIACLVLLMLIYRWCINERSRADRLEQSNAKLTNRFIRFVMQLPLEHRINVEDIEADAFDKKYDPHKPDNNSG